MEKSFGCSSWGPKVAICWWGSNGGLFLLYLSCTLHNVGDGEGDDEEKAYHGLLTTCGSQLCYAKTLIMILVNVGTHLVVILLLPCVALFEPSASEGRCVVVTRGSR